MLARETQRVSTGEGHALRLTSQAGCCEFVLLQVSGTFLSSHG